MGNSYQLLGQLHTADADVDLSGAYLRAVALQANGRVNLPVAGGDICGVLYTRPDARAGAACSYQFDAVAEWEAGVGGIAVRDYVKTDALGRCVKASELDRRSGAVKGQALTSATVGQSASIMLYLQVGTATGAEGNSVPGVETITLGGTGVNVLTNNVDTTLLVVVGTVTAVLPNGNYVGQKKRLIVSTASGTPIGTVTGLFKTVAGVNATTISGLDAVNDFWEGEWDGARWQTLIATSVTVA